MKPDEVFQLEVIMHSTIHDRIIKKIISACLCALLCLISGTGETAMSTEEKGERIFNFDSQEQVRQWRTIDDVVMGGVSQSTVTAGSQGTALFAGTVSLENFGGFASASSLPAEYNLAGFNGIAIRVRGDGKRYKFTVKTDTAFTGFSYQAPFNTENGTWAVIQLPFKTFVPMFRGSMMDNVGPIDPGEVKSFGFLIADKQNGPFKLEIDWIKAYK
jgi:NADH dehydrogenase [ubiquinone] 1 alpha subcomplex assembly factor 1